MVRQRRELVAERLVHARIGARRDGAFPGDRLAELLQHGLVVRVHVVLHVLDAVHGVAVHHELAHGQIAPQIVAGFFIQPAAQVVEDHVGRDAHGRAQHQGHQRDLLRHAPAVGRGVPDGQDDQREDQAGERRQLQPNRGSLGPERRVALRAVECPDRGGRGRPEMNRLAVVRQDQVVRVDLEALALVEVVGVAVRLGDRPVEQRFGGVVRRPPHDGVAA